MAGAVINDLSVSTATGMWYATTHNHLKMVMETSGMDNSTANKGSVEGCTDLPCTMNNSWHLVVDDTGFHELHSLATGNGFFDPRAVVSPVANAYNLCEVDIYGSPTKFAYNFRIMNPRLISVTTCHAMPENFDPSYESYINTILHSKESLNDAHSSYAGAHHDRHRPACSTGAWTEIAPEPIVKGGMEISRFLDLGLEFNAPFMAQPGNLV